MPMIAIGLLFLSLGLDTLAVAVGLGLSGLPRAHWRRVGLTFAFFEGLMPVVGLFIGHGLSHAFGEVAGYGAAGLLVLVGVLAVREALTGEDDERESPDVSGGRLLLAGLSVSLDELAVGFSLGVLHAPVGPALAFIALQAFALTLLGLSLGQRLGGRFGERAELASGTVLILLGFAVAVEQLTGGPFL